MARIRLLKQSADLTRRDFVQHPVWASVHCLDYDEPWYEGTDEATFRPWTGRLPVGPEEGMLLVRAQLTLADDRSLDGFVTPQHEADPESLGIMQPSVFLPSGIRCDFWDGMFKRPEEQRKKSLYAEMGDDPARIFPIRFRAEQ